MVHENVQFADLAKFEWRVTEAAHRTIESLSVRRSNSVPCLRSEESDARMQREDHLQQQYAHLMHGISVERADPRSEYMDWVRKRLCAGDLLGLRNKTQNGFGAEGPDTSSPRGSGARRV